MDMSDHDKHLKLYSKGLWIHFFKHLGIAMPLLGLSLLIGICGYHFIEGMVWIDALLNASMIMGGMGPANEIHTYNGKIFASAYALYSGLFLIAVTGYLLIPFLHRILKRLENR
jgi:hypothetical protein